MTTPSTTLDSSVVTSSNPALLSQEMPAAQSSGVPAGLSDVASSLESIETAIADSNNQELKDLQELFFSLPRPFYTFSVHTSQPESRRADMPQPFVRSDEIQELKRFQELGSFTE